MKKLIKLALTAVLIMTGMSVSANAAETVKMTVSASTATAEVGDTVEYTVVLNETDSEKLAFGTIDNFDESQFELLPPDQCVRLSN